MKKKKILMLGGLRYLLPVIEAAHDLGYYVITCDNVPNNIAHTQSDEYHNISLLDKESILTLAAELKIDGIMSFAVDPGVLTAAYVSDKLGLPGNPYKSVQILQNKAKFRKFLQCNGFIVPQSNGYKNVEEALADADTFNYPIIVKPTDLAGSKGVTKVETQSKLKKAVEVAIKASFTNEIIVEDFIMQDGFSSDSDGFSINGELRFISFSDQHFDKKAINPYTPSAYSWPASMSERHQVELRNEVQRLLTLLDMKTSIYNIETRVGIDGKAYIMEISPRGGGNRLSEMLRYTTGIDLIKNAVRASVGEEIVNVEMPKYDGYLGEVILHSEKDGIFSHLQISPEIKELVKEVDLWVNKGDKVPAFHAANNAIGTLVIRHEKKEKIAKTLSDIDIWLKVVVE